MAQNQRCLSCKKLGFIDSPPSRNPKSPRLQTPQMTCSDKGGTPSSIACTSAGKLQASQSHALYQVVPPPPRKTSMAMQNPPFSRCISYRKYGFSVTMLVFWSGTSKWQSWVWFSPLFVPRSCTEIAIALGVVRGDLGCLPRKGGTVHCWVNEAMKPGKLEAKIGRRKRFCTG